MLSIEEADKVKVPSLEEVTTFLFLNGWQLITKRSIDLWYHPESGNSWFHYENAYRDELTGHKLGIKRPINQ